LIKDLMHSISQLNAIKLSSKVQIVFNESSEVNIECIDGNSILNLCHLFCLMFTYGCSMHLRHVADDESDKINLMELFEKKNKNNKFNLCQRCLKQLTHCKQQSPIQIYYGCTQSPSPVTNAKIWKECKSNGCLFGHTHKKKEPVRDRTLQISTRQLPRFHDKNYHRFGRRHNLPLLTMSEISKHCISESCWIVVNDLVFDVTAFLPYHPASSECILKNSGGIDCELHFKFHSKNALKLLNKFVIGRVQKDNAIDCVIQ